MSACETCGGRGAYLEVSHDRSPGPNDWFKVLDPAGAGPPPHIQAWCIGAQLIRAAVCADCHDLRGPVFPPGSPEKRSLWP